MTSTLKGYDEAFFFSHSGSGSSCILSQASGFALGFQEAQNVILTNYVEVSRCVVHLEAIDIPGPFTLRMIERV
jgi:hypothetical protein